MTGGEGGTMKSVTGFFLLFLLAVTVGVISDAHLVRAIRTIYIRADGSIDPPTAPIVTLDHVLYSLTDNITADSTDGIVIQRNDMVLDGAHFAITGKMLNYSNGIVLDRANGVTVKNVLIRYFRNGIYGNASSNNYITEVSLVYNDQGINFVSSNFNVIDGNNINQNNWTGIWLQNSQYNNITRNKLTNTIANNFGGIRLQDFSDKNNVIDNYITTNRRYGIYIENSWSNCIYHNNFVDNLYQAYVDPATSQANKWDNGYSSGGNYWNDRSRSDFYSGIFQNESGSDEMVDIPYVIDFNNKDNYPLVKPWKTYQNETIFILADGSVDPTGAPLRRKGDVYTFIGNVNANESGIAIERDNMTLKGVGYTLQGTLAPYSTGVYISQRNNITTEGVKIHGFINGVVLNNTSNSKVSGNSITNSSYCICLLSSNRNSVESNSVATEMASGIILADSSNYNSILRNNISCSNGEGIDLSSSSANNITENSVHDGLNGIILEFSDNNTLSKNSVTGNNDVGILLLSSSDNVLRENSMVGNTYSFGVHGQFINDIDVSNTVDGKPIYYWVDKHDLSIPPDAGYVGLVECSNITVQNINVTSNKQGILLAHTTNSAITKNNVKNNDYGIELELSCSDNNISGNDLANNSIAIVLYSSSNNTISKNSIISDNLDGIALKSSSSQNNILSNTIIGNNGYGLSLRFSCDNNRISQNILASNRYGIGLDSSSHNNFNHNSLIENTQQVQSENSTNKWDDGYPSAGNYWSDYHGNDIFSGPYQNESGRDGIGDSLHALDLYDSDHYPLISPWAPPDIAVTNLATSKTVVGQGYAIMVNVTCENRGQKLESFNIIISANSSAIDSEPITLAIVNRTLVLKWNTTSFAYGNYTLSAYAEPLPEETSVLDNTFTLTIAIHVGVPGDVSGSIPGVYDGITNMKDIQYLIIQFGTFPISANWNPNADINGDSRVDIRDIAISILNFNKHE
jgi:parallel beta-helix repeat protein